MLNQTFSQLVMKIKRFLQKTYQDCESPGEITAMQDGEWGGEIFMPSLSAKRP
ncbi:MAG: hypothetical protein HWQ38_27455 [Nostoc sp. NMS7]|uniref:hypothetical protein n=1 Tax=Nostoc sp. NMS7 TaxID=2815391 RepID=UPI0025D42084|nr:hypothetical protein [Nostoc sp. NMS7]MBN3950005.1 hypothetical protein [Nostoc sp. NMS7]